MSATHYEVVVIGGGINGLSALYHVQRLGCRRVGLVEQFGMLHTRGSSHGASRITRSAYHHENYVRLMQHCHGESWPQLEVDAGQPLIFPNPCCVFGPKHGPFAKYAQAVLSGGADVREMDLPEARQKFPLFRFSEDDGILDDRTAGIVAAADTMQALYRLTTQAGATFWDHTQVQGFSHHGDCIQLQTSRGMIETERLIVTGGAWNANLLPFLSGHLSVTRQTVMYVELDWPSDMLQPGRFPVWAYLMDETNGLHYGLPPFGEYGVKVARHIVAGRTDDPNQEGALDKPMVDYLRSFLQRIFQPPVKRVIQTETCLYTNTPTEDFIIDLHPESPQIAIGAGCSGHAFKFGPLTGQILAELALYGRSRIPAFEQYRTMFSVELALQRAREIS